MYDPTVVKESGLTESGSKDGKPLYIGTPQQWDKAEKLQFEFDQHVDMEIDDMKMEQFENHDCHAGPEDGCDCQVKE